MMYWLISHVAQLNCMFVQFYSSDCSALWNFSPFWDATKFKSKSKSDLLLLSHDITALDQLVSLLSRISSTLSVMLWKGLFAGKD